MWSKLLNCGQHITFPTRDAKGREQSDAVLFKILEIAEKFTGHFPVKTGSYVAGKDGYIGGKDSVGDGRCGKTAGDISMGSKRSVLGGFASSVVEDTWLYSTSVSSPTTSWKLDNQMVNKKKWPHKEPATRYDHFFSVCISHESKENNAQGAINR